MFDIRVQTIITNYSTGQKAFYITITSFKNVLKFFNTSRQISKLIELDIDVYNRRMIEAMKVIGYNIYDLDEDDLAFPYKGVLEEESILKAFEEEFIRELTTTILS